MTFMKAVEWVYKDKKLKIILLYLKFKGAYDHN